MVARIYIYRYRTRILNIMTSIIPNDVVPYIFKVRKFSCKLVIWCHKEAKSAQSLPQPPYVQYIYSGEDTCLAHLTFYTCKTCKNAYIMYNPYHQTVSSMFHCPFDLIFFLTFNMRSRRLFGQMRSKSITRTDLILFGLI